MLLLNFFVQLITVLRNAASPVQIASGFIIGMIIGFTPSALINALLFILLILLNVNLASGFFAIALFRGFAYLFDPVLHAVGYFLLVEVDFFHPLWTTLYNIPFIPFTEYNNTVVMGSIAFSSLLIIPVYILVKRGVITYRESLDKRIANLGIIRYITASRLYQSFESVRKFKEKLWS